MSDCHKVLRFAMRPAQPTISVIDLTAQLGLSALAQLGAERPVGHGVWPQVALQGATWGPRFDWQRPSSMASLARPSATASLIVVIVGPGSVGLMRAALVMLASMVERPAVYLYLMPNALMEEMALQASAVNTLTHMEVYRLPDSSPQTLWLVLLEQLHQFGFRDAVLSSNDDSLHDHTAMNSNMQQSMDAAMTINGALAVALVDYRSGMCLAQAGGGFNLDLAAAGNTEVVRAKLKTVESLGLRKGIEDILITLADQYHLIRLVPNAQGLFLYLVLDKEKGNLALARFKLTDIERALRV